MALGNVQNSRMDQGGLIASILVPQYYPIKKPSQGMQLCNLTAYVLTSTAVIKLMVLYAKCKQCKWVTLFYQVPIS